MQHSTHGIALTILCLGVSALNGLSDELPAKLRQTLEKSVCIKCRYYVVRLHLADNEKLKDFAVMHQGWTVGSEKLEWLFVSAPTASYHVAKGSLVVEISNPHILWPNGSISKSGGARYELDLRELDKAATPTMQELHLFMKMEQKLQQEE